MAELKCDRCGLYARVIDQALRFTKGLEADTAGVKHSSTPATPDMAFGYPFAFLGVFTACTVHVENALSRFQSTRIAEAFAKGGRLIYWAKCLRKRWVWSDFVKTEN